MAPRDDLHLYALVRGDDERGLVMSHSSHSSHSSGSGYTTHYSHASHASHASHVSGGYTTHASGSTSSHHSGSTTSAPAHGRPDLRIGLVGGQLHGDNVYGTLRRQTVSQAGVPGKKLRWQLSVQNDAHVGDRIRLQGPASANGFTITYLNAHGANVTQAVEAGTFKTPRLPHGGTYRLTIVVRVTATATRAQALIAKLKATSMLSPGRSDVAAFVARRR